MTDKTYSIAQLRHANQCAFRDSLEKEFKPFFGDDKGAWFHAHECSKLGLFGYIKEYGSNDECVKAVEAFIDSCNYNLHKSNIQ